MAVLPAYLNALSSKGVHVVTVNDYLARRDSEWVGQVHRFLGLKVSGVNQAVPLPESWHRVPHAAMLCIPARPEELCMPLLLAGRDAGRHSLQGCNPCICVCAQMT